MRHDKDNSGLAVLEVSHKIYGRCLVFYPNDLRGQFGSEMIEVFDEQVSEAYSRSGSLGVLRVWLNAIREFVTVALPSRLAERMLPIAAVSTALGLLVWFAGYVGYVMETACQTCGH